MKKLQDPIIGTVQEEEGNGIVTIDVDRLIETRLVVTAISGGGKSHTVRRILEQTSGKVQHLIIDPEGEFYTLREKFPYLLAGRNGDCPAEVRSAGLLATKLLELRTSAILDIYGLTSDPASPNNRAHFVKAFLDALLNADQRLFHPCIVVIDEAHKFAPEKGEGESVATSSVINLMADGRKKQLCGILATQRISKLNKSAVSEAHNMMIGKSTLDVDVSRAMKNLGFKTGRENEIRRLKKGHFWTYGPALTDEVANVLVSDTITRSPKLGARMSKPAPPSGAIQKILKQLSDLPEEAAKKEQTEKDLRAEITELKRSLRVAPAIKFAEPLPVEKVVTKLVDRWAISPKQTKSLEGYANRIEKFVESFHKISQPVIAASVGVRDSIQASMKLITPTSKFVDVKPTMSSVTASPAKKAITHYHDQAREINKRVQAAAHEKEKAAVIAATTENGKLGICARRILSVLAQYPDDGCVAGKLTLLSGYRLTGSFKNALSELRTSGFMTGDNTSVMKITPEGVSAAGDVKPLPVGDELVNYWVNHPSFGVCERAILKTLIQHGEAPNGEKLAETTGTYKYTGSFKNALSSLRTAGVIIGVSNTAPIQLNPNLFQ